MTTCDAQSEAAGSAGCTPALETQVAGCVPGESSKTGSIEPTPPATLREFETALRGLGFSARKAAAIARSGFKLASDVDESAGDALETLRDVLNRNIATMKVKS